MKTFGIVGTCGIILVAVLAIALIAAISIFGYIDGIRGDAVTKETALSAQWNNNQASLDAGVTGVREQTNIGFLAGDEYSAVLREALEGKFGDEGLGTDSALFVAIAESYPDPSELLTIWSDIRQYIVDFRATFKGDQEKLQDMVRDYKDWKESSLFRKFVLDNVVGTPTENLEARVGNNVIYGQAALDVMSRVITSTETQNAFETGTYEGVFPQRPTTTPSER